MANSTVRPFSASARIADQNDRRPSTSMPVVGSSSSRSAGSDSSAIANRSRCCSPPEHLPTLRSASPVMPACARTSSTGWVSAKRLAVYATVSRTVRSLSRPPVCMTAETSPRAMACRGRKPSTSTVPAVGLERPSIMSMVVVLPAPLGPRKATISPCSISRSMPRTACTEPKSLVRPAMLIAGVAERVGSWVSRWSASAGSFMSPTMSHEPPSCPAATSRPRGDKCQPAEGGLGAEAAHLAPSERLTRRVW